MKNTLLLFLFFAPCVLAETVVERNADPISFERRTQAVQFEPNFAKNPPKPTAYRAELAGESLEQQINHAILSQEWQTLERLLADYANQIGRDPLLQDYAQAALAYGKGEHRQAIFHYQQLLAKKPELVYPRFDLALILAENHQYRDAENAFRQIAGKLPPDLTAIAERTLAQIDEAERWQPDIYLQYTQTDNVNNAAKSESVNVNGRIFRKDPDSLPQSATGLKYGVGVSKQHNLGCNHFIGGELRYGGIYYWDNRDYREQSLAFSPSYGYQTARYRLGFSPFIEQNWLGGARYNRQFGANLNGFWRQNAAWAWSGNLGHTQKRYADPLTASRYNGYQHQIGLGVQWQAVKNGRFFANLDASRELAREKAQSSNKWLARVGLLYQGERWASQWSVGFGKRYFADKHYLFGYKRQDNEYQANLAVWNRAWHWQGIVPKLNFSYRKIDSNIADFYSRQNKELFFTLEKAF